MELKQRKRKQQYIKAYCLMYPWYTYEAHCEWVEAGYKQYEIDYIDDSNDGLEVVLITGWEKDEDAE